MERYPTPDMDSYAGFLDRRFEAYLVDGLAVTTVICVLGFLAGTFAIGGRLGGFGGASLALTFVAPVVWFVYQIGFEGYYGQTPGKHLRGIVVVNDDGSDVGWFGAVVRNVARIVDLLPAFYLVGILAASVSDSTQRIGDVAGKTVVVYTKD